MQLPSYPEIKLFFPEFRKPTVLNFLLLVYCIVSTRSVSLNKCAEAAPKTAKLASRYQQLLRFVRMNDANAFCTCVGRLILAFLPQEQTYYLVIDRTNWKLGKSAINVLCLGLLLGGRYYIPLLWIPLDKNGSSSQLERIQLMKQFQQLWPAKAHFVLLADREFVGRDWINWLRKKGFGLVIRLRKDDYIDTVTCSLGKAYPHQQIERSLRKKGVFSCPINFYGHTLHFIALPDTKEKGKYVYLISHEADPHWVKQAYGRRWKIEVFFKQIKTDGFNMEDLGVTDLDRIRLVMAAASFAYALSIKQGLVEQEQRPLKIKGSKTKKTRWLEKSIFRYGLENLREKAGTLKRFFQLIIRLMKRKIPDFARMNAFYPAQTVQ